MNAVIVSTHPALEYRRNLVNAVNALTPTTASDPAGVVTHPTWCDPDRCTVEPDLPLDDARHLSRIVTIDGALTTVGPEDIDVWLHQGAAGDDVYLVLDVVGGVRAMFSLTAAAAATDSIAHLIEQATTHGDPLEGDPSECPNCGTRTGGGPCTNSYGGGPSCADVLADDTEAGRS